MLVGCLWGSIVGGGAAQAAPADSLVTTATSLRAALLRPSPVAAASARVQAGAGRSIPLAFGLSALVPGGGQAYNRQWVKAAVAVALEGALIVSILTARGDGQDATDVYKRYAHQHWSPLQYARWLEDYSDWLPDVERAEIDAAVVAGIDFTDPGAWSAAERQRVRQLFDAIHAVERRVYHPETGASFSHKLPYFGEQQYYELIGKYFQFAPGWEDYPEWKHEDAFTDAIDPEQTGPGGTKPNIQGRFLAYDDMSERANNLLRRASRLSAFLMLNHLISSIDAAVFAKLHNDRLDARVDLTYDAYGQLQPVASLRMRF